MATAYQKRMTLRKNSDLTRLAEQYKKNIQAATGEYETAFANYQKQRDELMAPYEASVKQYKEIQMPAYEAAVADYQRRLDDFNRAMSDYEANPKELTNIVGAHSRGGVSYRIGGKSYWEHQLPAEYSAETVKGKRVLYKDRPMPRGPGNAPTAPSAPQAPDVPEFDSAPFEQKRTQLQSEYQRETGERKGARLAAVGRKSTRPLLRDA